MNEETGFSWVGRCVGCGGLRAAASETLDATELKNYRRDWAGRGLEVFRMDDEAVRAAKWTCECGPVNRQMGLGLEVAG